MSGRLIPSGANPAAVPTPNGLIFTREWYDYFLSLSGAQAASGAAVADGDYGDIVVSGSGLVWTFDPSVVTAFARTLLDDVSAADMRTTLGIDASTTGYTPAVLANWGGSDPGDVDNALDYLAAYAVNAWTPETIPTGETFTVPAAKQVLFSMPINVDGTLIVDGFLIEVD